MILSGIACVVVSLIPAGTERTGMEHAQSASLCNLFKNSIAGSICCWQPFCSGHHNKIVVQQSLKTKQSITNL
jgi:hypothetical protein